MNDLTKFEPGGQSLPLRLNASEIVVPVSVATALATVPVNQNELSGLSVEELQRHVDDEVNMLDILRREGQQRIRTRLLVLFAEMARRFDEGVTFNGLIGKRAMAAYLRSQGFDPGKLRVWRFLMRREEMATLAGETATEADAVVDDAAIVIPGDGTPVAEEPQDVTVRTSVMVEDLSIPTAGVGSADFDTAADFLKSSCLSLFTEFAVQRILSMLADRPGVLAHAECLEDLASVLRSTAEGADNLAREISNTLAAPLRTV